MQSYNRKTRKALSKLARSKRIKSNRVRNQLCQRLLGIGPLESAKVLASTPIVPHPKWPERAARIQLAEATAPAVRAQLERRRYAREVRRG